MDLASETATFGFDDVSLTDPFLSGSDKAIFNNPKHPFMVKLKSHLKKASDLKKEDYGVFFASAGHAALYDYPNAKGLQAVASNIWDRGGVVGTGNSSVGAIGVIGKILVDAGDGRGSRLRDRPEC